MTAAFGRDGLAAGLKMILLWDAGAEPRVAELERSLRERLQLRSFNVDRSQHGRGRGRLARLQPQDHATEVP